MSIREPLVSGVMRGRQPQSVAPTGRDQRAATSIPRRFPAASAVTSGVTPGAPRSPDDRLPPPGARVGQYELIRELGRGGMGAVYLARDTKLGRRVAVKFLQSDQPELTARFILEARATARCSHENIVVIHEVGEYEGNPFMVLEYLQGGELGKQIQPGRSMPMSRAVELIVPVVRALACAHEHNIVHRDLKPDNIFVTEAGTVKVLDFGIAKLVQGQVQSEGVAEGVNQSLIAASISDASPELTRHGALVGTVPYMSPEQWMGAGVDHRTDIWAVGIILYKMVAGKHPLAPLQGRQLMVTGLLDEPMPSVGSDCPDLPDELIAVIDRCLIKNKDQRMGSAQALLHALEPLLPGRNTRKLRIHESPYPGLSAFQESDANRFFGRAGEVAAAVTRLRDQPLLGVVGPSGVGKSSFVRAGLVPALKLSGEKWSSIVVRPGRQPMAALAHAVAPMVSRSPSMAEGTVAGDLAEHQAVYDRLCNEPGYLGTVLRSRARRRGHKILLFVDQFEELYTLVGDARERLAFTACLASVADDATTPLRVVLSVRADFLDRVAEDPYFMAELAHSLFFLSPPSRDGLREAIVEPAEMAGFQFEAAGVVEHMLDHLQHTPGALPLLQFAASKLWDLRDTERKLLTEDSYRAIGGITGALASHADAVVAELPQQTQALARTLFLRLITPERTRAVVPVGELQELAKDPDEVQRLVDHLVHARLIVVQGGVQGGDGDGSASAEIVHESLIQSWPRLRRWLDENQDDAAFLEQLRNAARQWQAKGRPTGLLWRGEAMAEARRWHRRYRGELPQLQRDYLDAVFALGARSTRRRRYLVAGIIVFLSLLVAATTIGMLLIRDAKQEAESKAVVAQRAEVQVREQLARVQAEERARREAELREREAREDAEQANEQVALTNATLAQRNDELSDALTGANKAKRRARRARKRAEQDEAAALTASAEALAAEADAQRANEKLQSLLDRERKRIRELQRRTGIIIEYLSKEDLAAE